VIAFYPLLPGWLIAVLLAAAVTAVFVAYRHRNPVASPRQHALLMGLRLLTLVVLTLILLCPGTVVDDLNAQRSHVVFLMDRSASMGVRDMPAAASRHAAAVKFVTGLDLSALSDYPVRHYAFNDKAEPLAAPAALSESGPQGGTDYAEAFRRVETDIGAARAAAIVMVSDGIDLAPPGAASTSIPVFCVRTGTDLAAARDLGLDRFTFPAKVNQGDEVTFDIPVSLSGYPAAQRAELAITVDAAAPQRRPLELVAGRPHGETFSHRFDAEGMHVVGLELSELPDEATLLNNRRELAIEVVRARTELLAYFPILTNSFRPLLREFENDEEVVFTACYRMAGEAYGLRGRTPNTAFIRGLEGAAEALRQMNAVILGAHNGDLLSPADAQTLDRYVSAGGSLILLGGGDSFGELPADSPLRELSPVTHLEKPFTDERFTVAVDPAENGALARQVREILAADGQPEDLVLTGIDHVRDVKPNARVLLWAEGAQRLPLLVWQPYGQGKVIALLTNAMHTWGTGETRDRNYGLFWRQLIALARTTDDAADILQFTVNKSELTTEDSLTVSATARPPAGLDEAAITVRAELLAADGNPLRAQDLARRDGVHTGEFAPLPAGRYVLRVQVLSGEQILRQRFRCLLVGEISREGTDVRSGDAVFRRLSPPSRIYTPDQGAMLVQDLRAAVLKNKIERELFVIYESPVPLIAVLGLLLAEWFLRRRFNLF